MINWPWEKCPVAVKSNNLISYLPILTLLHCLTCKWQKHSFGIHIYSIWYKFDLWFVIERDRERDSNQIRIKEKKKKKKKKFVYMFIVDRKWIEIDRYWLCR